MTKLGLQYIDNKIHNLKNTESRLKVYQKVLTQIDDQCHLEDYSATINGRGVYIQCEGEEKEVLRAIELLITELGFPVPPHWVAYNRKDRAVFYQVLKDNNITLKASFWPGKWSYTDQEGKVEVVKESLADFV